jgi:hypothetical protein
MMTTPTPITTPEKPISLDEMARYINDGHKAVTDAEGQAKDASGHAKEARHRAFEKAMRTGYWLNQAKAKLDHGKWLPWLKANCPTIAKSKRTYQRWMKLADNEAKLKEVMRGKNDTMTHLTINEALRWVDGKGDDTPSDKYDKAEENLIKKLKRLTLEEAEAASQATSKELKETVATMKLGAPKKLTSAEAA